VTLGAGRILVVDRDSPERDRLVGDLEDAGLSVRCASSAVAAARELRAPLALLLVSLNNQELDGVDFIRRLAPECVPAPIVVLSRRGDDGRIIAAISAGARGCLFSDDLGDRLVPAVREALAGGAPMSRGMGPLLLEHVRRAGRRSASTQRAAVRPITNGERRVLEQLARPLSYEQVGSILGVSVNTVRSHVRVIYDKLGVNTRTEAVVLAMKLGLVPGPHPGSKPTR
jgi:DNA-binding NarL/FixJ family response regulator